MKQRISSTISTVSNSLTTLEQLSPLAPHGEVYFYTAQPQNDIREDVTVAKLEDNGIYYTVDGILLPVPVTEERTWNYIGW